MKYYRIDRRIFQLNELIKPSASFYNHSDSRRIEIEDILEDNRPIDKPNRNEVVKVFNSFDAAKKYWILDPNSIFYEVSVEADQILHQGNYDLLTEISNTKDKERQRKMSIEYWMNDINTPCTLEFYIKEAPVIRIICNNEKIRKNTKRSHYRYDTIPGIPILKDE